FLELVGRGGERVVVADDRGELERDRLRNGGRRHDESRDGEEHEEALHRGLHGWSEVGPGGRSSIPARGPPQGPRRAAPITSARLSPPPRRSCRRSISSWPGRAASGAW